MTPAFRIVVAGLDVTQQVADRLLQLEVTDGEGVRSDRCSLVLDDRDSVVQLPRPGAEMQVHMGYRETGLAFMGRFRIADVELSGYPRQLAIRATAVDMQRKLKETRNHAYSNKTVGEIVQEIAGRHGLQAQVAQSLSSFRYRYLPQTAESDMNLLTAMARRHDALFKIANGRLIFAKRGEARAGDGGGTGVIVIRGDLAGGGQVKRYTVTAMARPQHGRVTSATWNRVAGFERRIEHGLDLADAAATEHLLGGLDLADAAATEHLLAHRGSTDEEAEEDARSDAQRRAREKAQLSIDIVGNPAAGADMTLVVEGVRPGAADGTWRIKTATHTITGEGFSTSIQAELPGEGNARQGDELERRITETVDSPLATDPLATP